MSSSFWLLGVESHYFSQAEKERTSCKAEQIHKMTIFFTQNGPRLLFWGKIVVILWIFSALQAVLSFSATQLPKTRALVEHPSLMSLISRNLPKSFATPWWLYSFLIAIKSGNGSRHVVLTLYCTQKECLSFLLLSFGFYSYKCSPILSTYKCI